MYVRNMVRHFHTKTGDESGNASGDPETVPFSSDLIENSVTEVISDITEMQQTALSPTFTTKQSNDTQKSTLLSTSEKLPIKTYILIPPPPPARSPTTKISLNPLNTAFKLLNFSTDNGAVSNPSSQATVSTLIQKQDDSAIQTLYNFPKNVHSITTAFDSEIPIAVNDGDVEKASDTNSNNKESSVDTATMTLPLSTKFGINDNLVMVTLKKSVNGFGFSLTSRQNPVDLTNPVYVSKVLDNGPAILDGRMKAGDRIMTINNEDVGHLSQKDIKEILLNILVDTFVNIGLYRQNSDTISSMLVSSKNLILKKINPPSTQNQSDHSDSINNENHPSLLEEKKASQFSMCDCVYNYNIMDSEFDIYHFIISQKSMKSDTLSPQLIDSISKSFETKTEPPAIQLHHQNKLSPKLKQSTDTKYSHATLGISVRKGFSQLFFNDFQSVSQYPSGTSTLSRKIKFGDNQAEYCHKICPNCHGLLSLSNGVFVTTVIPGGAAYLDGRLSNGDEILAVQGVSLNDGERFVFPGNKVPLGDSYESLKSAQISSQYQNRSCTINTTISNVEDEKRADPLILLKQLLTHAQSISSSVSLVILRRNSEKRGLSSYTLTSTESNIRYNVTVAADVHTQNSKELFKTENFNLIGPHFSTSNNPLITLSNKDCAKEISVKDNRRRFYDNEDIDSAEYSASTDLICLDSEHEMDNLCTEKEAINSQNDNEKHVEECPISPKLFDEIEKRSKTIPIICDNTQNIHSPSQLSPTSCQVSMLYTVSENDLNLLDSTAQLYFSREDNTRQSFSLKRIHLNAPQSSRMSRLSLFKTVEKSNVYKTFPNHHYGSKRPKSEVILSRVEEESSDSDVAEQTDVDERVKTNDRKPALRRRAVITRRKSRKSSS